MNEQQYETLLELAKRELETAQYEKDWGNYIEGITDMAYALKDYDLMNRLDNRLWLMWELKRQEGNK